MAVADFDYFILDTEQGSYGLETISDMMVAARLAGITAIVRFRTVRTRSSPRAALRHARARPSDAASVGNKGVRLLLYSYDFGLIMSGGAAAIQELRR